MCGLRLSVNCSSCSTTHVKSTARLGGHHQVLCKNRPSSAAETAPDKETLCATGTFDLLLYTDKSSEVSAEWCVVIPFIPAQLLVPSSLPSAADVRVDAEWHLPQYCQCVRREDSDPRYITHAEDVKLRAFTTKVSRGPSHCPSTVFD